MDTQSKRQIRANRDALTRRFAEHEFGKKRNPREVVIEILSEGLWTLICQGRGPASGDFDAPVRSVRSVRDRGDDGIRQSLSTVLFQSSY